MIKFSNNKPYNPHGYKEEVKVKYDFVRATARKIPNETAATMVLFAASVPPLDWARYCVLTPDKQLAWEERGDVLTKAMFI